MKGVKVTELPPLVYQLLVLSVKGHRATVLNGVRSLFNQLDQEVFGANDVEEEDRCGGREGGDRRWGRECSQVAQLLYARAV